MPSVFIFGANGYMGGHLKNYLQQKNWTVFDERILPSLSYLFVNTGNFGNLHIIAVCPKSVSSYISFGFTEHIITYSFNFKAHLYSSS